MTTRKLSALALARIAEARRAKAEQIVGYIDAHELPKLKLRPHADALEIAHFLMLCSPEWWGRVALRARVRRCPSDETIQIVVATYLTRATAQLIMEAS